MEHWLMLLPEFLVVFIIVGLWLDTRKQQAAGNEAEKNYNEKLGHSLIALTIICVPELLVSIGCLITNNADNLEHWRLRTAFICMPILIIYIIFHKVKNNK